jgi:hypothetical protein
MAVQVWRRCEKEYSIADTLHLLTITRHKRIYKGSSEVTRRKADRKTEYLTTSIIKCHCRDKRRRAPLRRAFTLSAAPASRGASDSAKQMERVRELSFKRKKRLSYSKAKPVEREAQELKVFVLFVSLSSNSA